MPGVLIDVTRLLRRFLSERLPTGVDRVSLAYIRHYGPQARAALLYRGAKFLFRRKESSLLFNWLLTPRPVTSPIPFLCKGLVAGCTAQRISNSNSVLFNTGHSGLDSAGYVATMRKHQVKPVFMVHDLIPITHPQFCRVGEREKHLARMRNAVHSASGIVCNSQATLQALGGLCSDQGWPMPPAIASLLAPGLPNVMDTARPSADTYFVFVSTIEPRKNHLMLLKVWERLAAQLGALAPKLIIIGQHGWHCSDVTHLLTHSAALKTLVTHVPACSDALMTRYLVHARALLFPSFAEGFGMPVIEALAHGVPVIANDLPVYREFAGNIPDYLNATDRTQWARVIADYALAESPLRAAQLQRMRGFTAPTWEQHFERVDAFLEELEHRA